MATCKDCVHFKVCEWEGVYFEDQCIRASSADSIEDLCPLFEDKDDFVEVVRCKNCIHKVDYCGRIMCDKNARRINDGIAGLRATNPECFCSDGERREE